MNVLVAAIAAILALVQNVCALPEPVTLLLISPNDNTREQVEAMARVAAIIVNSDTTINSTISIDIMTVPGEATPMETLATLCAQLSTTTTPVSGIVGPQLSREATMVASWASIANVPVVSYSATMPMLSADEFYPTFMRTVPSDAWVQKAVVALLHKFNIGRAAILAQNDDYGLGGLNSLLTIVSQAVPRIQITVTNTFGYRDLAGLDGALNQTKQVDARYIILWATPANAEAVLQRAWELGMVSGLYSWILAAGTTMSAANVTDTGKFDGVISIEPAYALSTPSSNVALRTMALNTLARYFPGAFPAEFQLDVYAFYAFDAVLLYATALKPLVANGWAGARLQNHSCFDPLMSDISLGLYMTSLRQTVLRGVTGVISYLPGGHDRDNADVSVASLGASAVGRTWSDVAAWSASGFSPQDFELSWIGGSRVPPSDVDVLRGKTLHALAKVQAPFVMPPDQSGSSALLGFTTELLGAMSQNLGIIIEYTVGPLNLTYNALVLGTATGGYDISVGDITITGQRETIVAFSMPYYYDGMRLAARKASSPSLDLFNFLAPFTMELWVTYALVAVACGVLFFLFEADSNTELIELGNNHSWKMLGVSIWHSALGFLMRDFVTPVTAAGRLITVGLVISSTVVVSTYTASVATALTAQALSTSIKGMQDIISGKISPARVGVMPNSAHSDWFTREVSPIFTPIETLTIGLELLSASQLDAVFADGSSLTYLINSNFCDLEVLPDAVATSDFGFVLHKDWIHTNDFNVALLNLRESGYLAELNAKYFGASICAAEASAISGFSQMGMQGMGGVFLTLLFFVIIAVLVYLAKHMIIWKVKQGSVCAPCRKSPLLERNPPPAESLFTTSESSEFPAKSMQRAPRQSRVSIANAISHVSHQVLNDIDALQQTRSSPAPAYTRRKLNRGMNASCNATEDKILQTVATSMSDVSTNPLRGYELGHTR
jgi:ABC-type amino acid transport substrate-binding protein/ABC-type branched-subunit amino acid transport system substrate-binding protein